MSDFVLPLPETHRRTPLGLGDAFALFAPMALFIQIRTIGLLYLTDFLFLLVAPVIVARGLGRLMDKPVLKYLFLCSLWLTSQIVTDFWRGSSSSDFLRGWSKIGLTLFHFVIIWLLARKSIRRLMLMGVGFSVGIILSTIISPSAVVQEDPWKYGYGSTVTLLCVMASADMLRRTRSKTAFTVAMSTLSAFNVYMGFRGLAGVCLLAMAFTNFHVGSHRLRRRLGRLQLALVALMLALVGWGLLSLYGYGALQGWFGKEASVKYRAQSRGAGILLGGRSEIFASSAAIMDSPFLGHGSWAKDPKYAQIMKVRQAELGYREAYVDPKDRGLIPTHSHLFGAWVEAGVAGAAFWFWVLLVTLGALRRVTGKEPMLPVFAFLAFQLAWDVLFSPYGAEQRFLTTYSIAAMLILSSITDSIRANDELEEVSA